MTAAIPRKLWEHPNPKNTQMFKFMQEVNKKHNLDLNVSGRSHNRAELVLTDNSPFGVCINGRSPTGRPSGQT